jgi:hypothetical protein
MPIRPLNEERTIILNFHERKKDSICFDGYSIRWSIDVIDVRARSFSFDGDQIFSQSCSASRIALHTPLSPRIRYSKGEKPKSVEAKYHAQLFAQIFINVVHTWRVNYEQKREREREEGN